MEFTIILLNEHGGDNHQYVAGINNLQQQLTPGPQNAVDADALTNAIRNSFVFLAIDKAGKVLGMATLVVISKCRGRRGRVEDVVVDHSARGKGLGKLLMQALIAEARRERLGKLDLTTGTERTAANGLYQSLGFTQCDMNAYCLAL